MPTYQRIYMEKKKREEEEMAKKRQENFEREI
jgi:hypothetical protein